MTEASPADGDLLAAAGERPGRATVYRTIEQLHGTGWLARIHPEGAEAGAGQADEDIVDAEVVEDEDEKKN